MGKLGNWIVRIWMLAVLAGVVTVISYLHS